MKPILEIQNISKKFSIYGNKQPYLSLRDQITNVFKPNKNKKEDFWALKDISFEVYPGESTGIIGKNGAGKSTLLKILSKITPPTSGKIISRGRIASLLEVGTGFHPELSGRENIYLNGSILGMKRAEINAKFDEIVDFSGVEKFLETPLKHYSSGMQLRLAFAVAAFLEPEILIIDEVLAVGDAEFQKKCMGKMDEVSKSGRTILFVSHNMGAIQGLCRNTIFLNAGFKIEEGKTQQIINNYLEQMFKNIYKTREIKDRNIYIEDLKIQSYNTSEKLIISVDVYSSCKTKVAIDLRLVSGNGNSAAFGSIGTFDQNNMVPLSIGRNNLKLEITTRELANGQYNLSIDLTNPDKEYYDRFENALFFEVSNISPGIGCRTLLQEWNYGFYKLPVQLSI